MHVFLGRGNKQLLSRPSTFCSNAWAGPQIACACCPPLSPFAFGDKHLQNIHLSFLLLLSSEKWRRFFPSPSPDFCGETKYFCNLRVFTRWWQRSASWISIFLALSLAWMIMYYSLFCTLSTLSPFVIVKKPVQAMVVAHVGLADWARVQNHSRPNIKAEAGFLKCCCKRATTGFSYHGGEIERNQV